MISVLLLILVVAIGTRVVTSGYYDGPSTVFGRGVPVSGELTTGTEPDWGFALDIGTIDLQLLEPPRFQLIWIVEHEDNLYLAPFYLVSGGALVAVVVTDLYERVATGYIAGQALSWLVRVTR